LGLRRRSLSGQGLGSGFSSVVPEVYTDMIAAALAENLGFAATVLLYALLFYALLVAHGFPTGLSSRRL
jgi:cell division protein FtsW (lipid II flippase)